MYHYSGTNKQLLQVGRLDQALILLGLALYLPSAFLSSVCSASDSGMTLKSGLGVTQGHLKW